MTPPPAIVSFTGDWTEYLDQIYGHYLSEVIETTYYIQGKPVKARYNPATDGKGFSFWHVISEGESEEDRVPDLRRCERIRWLAWMLDRAASGDTALLVWKNHRTTRKGTKERLVLFCEQNMYVVVLEERVDRFMLITGYPVHERRASNLKKEWQSLQK